MPVNVFLRIYYVCLFVCVCVCELNPSPSPCPLPPWPAMVACPQIPLMGIRELRQQLSGRGLDPSGKRHLLEDRLRDAFVREAREKELEVGGVLGV